MDNLQQEKPEFQCSAKQLSFEESNLQSLERKVISYFIFSNIFILIHFPWKLYMLTLMHHKFVPEKLFRRAYEICQCLCICPSMRQSVRNEILENL